MKLALLSSVPLRTLLLVFSAVLGIAQVAEADTTTTTDGNATDSNSGTTTSISISNVTSEGSTVEQTTSVSLFTSPAAVSGVTAIGNTTAMTVSWKKAVGLVGSYAVLLFRDNLMVKNVTDLSNFTTNVGFTDLIPGVLYCVEVITTSGPFTNRTSRVCNATFPNPPGPIMVDSQTVNSINFTWPFPEGMDHNQYNFSVSGHNGSFVISKNWYVLQNLESGSPYHLSVVTVGVWHYESTAVTTFNYTKAAAVSGVTAIGNTTAMTVSWKKAVGLVGSYAVLLFRDNLMVKNVTDLSNFTTNVGFTDLIPGVLYCVEVITTSGPFTNRTSRVCNATFPNPPGPIMVDSQTVNSINFTWPFPEGMDHNQYNFSVSGHNGSFVISKNWYVLQNLESGSPYHLSVVTVGVWHYESTAVTTFKYTKAAAVSGVTAIGNTTAMTVSWKKAVGLVGSYAVLLFRDNLMVKNITDLSNFTTNVGFTDLIPGVLYCVEVITTSGPFTNRTSRVCNATFPNPPGPIMVDSQTVNSINFTWPFPEGMDHNQYNFSVSGHNGSFVISKNWYVLQNLESGSPYHLSVVTVGVWHYESTAVTTFNYTKAAAVSGVTAIGNTTAMTVSWKKAVGLVGSYAVLLFRDNLMVKNVTDLSNFTTNVGFTDLIPGVLYCVEVITTSGPFTNRTSRVCNATFPNPPGPIMVDSQTVNSINFTWPFPEGMDHNQYNFSVSGHNGSFVISKNWYVLQNLESGSPYHLSVVTVGVWHYESTAVTTFNYTKAAAVSGVTAIGNTTAMTVSWKKAVGLVGSYAVLLFRDNLMVKNVTDLSNFTTNVGFTDLIPGVLYCVEVITTSGPFTNRTSRVCNATFPNPPGPIMVDSQTVNSINFTWPFPEGMDHNQYNFSVSGHNGSFVISKNWYVLQNLESGSPYHLSVVTVGVWHYESTAVTTFNYTKPAAVSGVTAIGNTTAMTVSWKEAVGLVGSYAVLLFRDNLMVTNDTDLSNFTTNVGFTDLIPGVLYCVEVITTSGPFTNRTSRVCNATFPNPPGPIMVDSQTVNSINFTWPFPEGMDHNQYNFSVSSHNGSFVISKNWYVLQNLESGSPYNLSVVTVGVWHYESTAVTTFNYTRPLSVNNLRTSTEEESITVMWEKPDQYKESYCYILSWHSSDESIRNTPTRGFYSKINDLVPGKPYNISVTTKTADGTEGAPIWISVCTNAGAVKDLICDGPDTTIAQVILSWKKNNGQNSGFKVTVNNGETVNYTRSCCNYTVSNLRHNTSYNLSVETQSCGLPSRPETHSCWTGITNPSIPENYQDLVVVRNKEYNKFNLQIKRGLLDSINGPITHVGVLVTQTDPGASDLTTYVSKTYQEWKEQATQVYMATVKNLTETTVTSRSEEGPLDIEIGSENKWGAYFNGPLEANEKYQYAIVLFTRLTLDNQLVTGKLLAATKFYNFVQLPQNPVVISIAIGVTLGIFCVLLIILIGFIIYWKRLSNKDSPDIQIHSLR
ncbi:receptor-type tyrosine-protein phosphatase beta isoform X2 [Gasterosteus aculeatus]